MNLGEHLTKAKILMGEYWHVLQSLPALLNRVFAPPQLIEQRAYVRPRLVRRRRSARNPFLF